VRPRILLRWQFCGTREQLVLEPSLRRCLFATLLVLASGQHMTVVALAGGVGSHSEIPDLAHPLIAESPTPDTELRFEYLFVDKQNADEHIVNPEGELAIASWASIEVDAPYVFRDSKVGAGSEDNFGVAEIALKLAHGLSQSALIGGGLELGLPTGNDTKEIGSDNELVIEPFIDFGVKFKTFEVITFLGFGVPINQQSAEEREAKDLELEYNVAFAYWFVPSTRFILEFDGESVVIGDDNKGVVNLTVGFIGAPSGDVPLEIGGGISFPITADKEFDNRLIFSVLYQF